MAAMSSERFPDLPVAGVLDEAVAASRGGAVVVTAPPGSGKTMLVPAAVLDDLPAGERVILLQPRRLAARAVARRIAQLRGGRVGGEVGYQVRFDSCVGRDTRLIVATTGILLRRLLDDVALEDVGAVVLDEFHERTIEMDLVLGLVLRIRQTLRPDLRVIVMSATLAAEPVPRLLGDCPVVHAEGRRYPVAVRYQRRGERRPLAEVVAAMVPEAVRETAGHVLVFLPGVGEILRSQQALAPFAERQGLALLPLFGDLPAEAQDRALADLGQRKIILATNVAETSLTIEGVTAVVDSGQARQLHVSPATGLPRLELLPISQASAEQRAGRAGRTAPGICWRLWDESSHRGRPTAETPEVLRSDLAEPLLHLFALGERSEFPWLDPPPEDAVENARTLLRSSAPSTRRTASHRSATSSHGCRRTRGWEGCYWQGHGRECYGKLRSPRRSCQSAIRFVRRSMVAAGRATMARCGRGPISSIGSPPCRRFMRACTLTIRTLSCIRAVPETCCGLPNSCIILRTLSARRGPSAWIWR